MGVVRDGEPLSPVGHVARKENTSLHQSVQSSLHNQKQEEVKKYGSEMQRLGDDDYE